MHVGGVSVSEVVNFARNSIWAPNLETLNPSTFPECLEDGHPWVVDFYAPWCPPCMRLIPEFRRVSLSAELFKFTGTFLRYILILGQQYGWWHSQIWFSGLLRISRSLCLVRYTLVSNCDLL